MSFLKPKYDLKFEINRINSELAMISALKDTINTRGWIEIANIFAGVIGRFTQEILDKCDDPRKNEIEIKSKKMVAEALGSILANIDSRVRTESYLRQQAVDKTAKAEEIKRIKEMV